MSYYIAIGIIVTFIGLSTAEKHYKIGYLLIIIILSLFFGLRGAFTSDYNNYLYLFNYYHATDLRTILSVTTAQEVGFVLITKVLSNFISYQSYLLIMGSIIVSCFIYGFITESEKPWISIILFLGFGSYYGSFNTMRQSLASAILFAGCHFLYSREFRKYVIVVIIAATIHITSIIMIPFYFFLNFRVNKQYVMRLIAFSFFALVGLKGAIVFVQNNLPKFSVYSLGTYGMTQGSLGYFVAPVVMLLLIVLLYYTGSASTINRSDKSVRIQINALGFSFIVALLTTQAFLLYRFADFFLPHVFLLVSNMLAKSKSKNNKQIITGGIVAICIMYTYFALNGTGYDPYYFFWQT